MVISEGILGADGVTSCTLAGLDSFNIVGSLLA